MHFPKTQMNISVPHVIFQATLFPDKICLPRMNKKLTQQESMHMNSSVYAALLVTSSWKIWLGAVVKTKQVLPVIRGLWERTIHTNKVISQGSYKTVINPADCSQFNRTATETRRTTTGKKSSWKTQAQQEAELENTDHKVPCCTTGSYWAMKSSLTFSSGSHNPVRVCPMQQPSQDPSSSQQAAIETSAALSQGKDSSLCHHLVYCCKYWVAQWVALLTSYHCLKVSWLVTTGCNK